MKNKTLFIVLKRTIYNFFKYIYFCGIHLKTAEILELQEIFETSAVLGSVEGENRPNLIKKPFLS